MKQRPNVSHPPNGFELEKHGPCWVVFLVWDDDGLKRKRAVASSPNPEAVNAALWLLQGRAA